jgi:hypothetical protein
MNRAPNNRSQTDSQPRSHPKSRNQSFQLTPPLTRRKAQILKLGEVPDAIIHIIYKLPKSLSPAKKKCVSRLPYISIEKFQGPSKSDSFIRVIAMSVQVRLRAVPARPPPCDILTGDRGHRLCITCGGHVVSNNVR